MMQRKSIPSEGAGLAIGGYEQAMAQQKGDQQTACPAARAGSNAEEERHSRRAWRRRRARPRYWRV